MLEAFLPATEKLLCNCYPVQFSLPLGVLSRLHGTSDFILDFGKLPFPLHKFGKIFQRYLGGKIPKYYY